MDHGSGRMDRHTAEAAIPGTRRAGTAAAGGGIAAKYVRAKDFATFVKLPLAALVAWTLPEPWRNQVAGAGLGRSAGRIGGDRQHLRAFLGGELRLATGAPNLALRTG